MPVCLLPRMGDLWLQRLVKICVHSRLTSDSELRVKTVTGEKHCLTKFTESNIVQVEIPRHHHLQFDE